MGSSASQLCDSSSSHGSSRTALSLTSALAPAKEALFAMTIPTAEAVKCHYAVWVRTSFSSCMVIRVQLEGCRSFRQ